MYLVLPSHLHLLNESSYEKACPEAARVLIFQLHLGLKCLIVSLPLSQKHIVFDTFLFSHETFSCECFLSKLDANVFKVALVTVIGYVDGQRKFTQSGNHDTHRQDHIAFDLDHISLVLLKY